MSAFRVTLVTETPAMLCSHGAPTVCLNGLQWGSVCGQRGPASIKDKSGEGIDSSLQVLLVITPVLVESNSGSRQRVILPPRGPWPMSGDVFGCPNHAGASGIE